MTISNGGALVVIRFDRKPSRMVLDTVKSCGFKPVEPLAYARRNDHNGRCAAEYFEKMYKELTK